MRTKKGLSHAILFAVLASLIVLGGIGSAYAQNVQQAILDPASITADPGGAVDVTVTYNSEDKTVTLFSALIHYDSSRLVYGSADVLHSDASQTVSDRDEEANEDDGDANTDRVVIIAYNDIFTGGDWPGDSVAMPLSLATISFTSTTATGTTAINVTGSPAGGSTFEGTGANVTVGDVTKYSLTTEVTGTGTGNITRTPDATEYAEGDTIELLATATTGEFVIWSNGDTANPTTITMEDAAMTVNATINLAVVDTFTLTLNAANGTAVPDTVGPYALDTVVTITATPATGYKFVNWTGDVADANAATTTVTMDANKTVTANFVDATKYALTLNASPAAGGTAAPSTAGPYDPNTVVTITATPAANYQFVNWTGAVADSSVATTTVTMDADKTVTANFKLVDCDADATFTATKNGLTVTFNVSSSVQQTLSFDYGDGTSGAATTHTYTTAGEYDVDLTATISDDCTDEVSLSVTVTDIDPCADYEYGYGDYDQDDEIDIFDALGIAMHVVEIQGSVITDPCHLDALDVDENGKVDIDDALAIARFDVQLDCYCVLNP